MGKRLRVASNLDVCMRVGFDVQPLDFTRDDDVAWGRACIWAARKYEHSSRYRSWANQRYHGIREILLVAVTPGRIFLSRRHNRHFYRSSRSVNQPTSRRT
ncbi:MAG: DUF2332 family protein [Polyangiaceae bacterium]